MYKAALEQSFKGKLSANWYHPVIKIPKITERAFIKLLPQKVIRNTCN